jgi:hypothetical protein
VTGYQVASLVEKAYLKAATVEVAVSGFRKTGLFPVNRNIFIEHEFTMEDLEQTEPSNAHSSFGLLADISPVQTRRITGTSASSVYHLDRVLQFL